MSSSPYQVKIDTVSGGVVQFGPTLFISPKSASKTALGSGASNTGFQINTFSGSSATNSVDTDVVDQPIIRDN